VLFFHRLLWNDQKALRDCRFDFFLPGKLLLLLPDELFLLGQILSRLLRNRLSQKAPLLQLLEPFQRRLATLHERLALRGAKN
jgi:hypothetical protein